MMNLGYTGKPYDTSTGLYNYGFRDYRPQAARFTTLDPVRDGSNWFSYVNNDPVNYVDLWGLAASDNKPVFIFGLSANATFNSGSVGNTTGVYFVPNNLGDPLFHIAYSFMTSTLTNPVAKVVTPMVLTVLISRSSDYGVFSDILNSGVGVGLSASAGISTGIFTSVNDLAGPYGEFGASTSITGIPLSSVGVDVAINKDKNLSVLHQQ